MIMTNTQNTALEDKAEEPLSTKARRGPEVYIPPRVRTGKKQREGSNFYNCFICIYVYIYNCKICFIYKYALKYCKIYMLF